MVLLSVLCKSWGEESMCKDEIRVSHGNVRMLFVILGFIAGGSCPSLGRHYGALSVDRALKLERRALHEQGTHGGHAFGAEKKTSGSCVLTQERRDGTEKVWACSLLVLLWGLM